VLDFTDFAAMLRNGAGASEPQLNQAFSAFEAMFPTKLSTTWVENLKSLSES
jgi:hypothetical protein